jgi:ABC-2 type transport system permease protein
MKSLSILLEQIMRRILKIARREFISGVRSKTFIISVVFAPLMVGAIFFFTKKMIESKPASRPPLKTAFTDRSNRLYGRIIENFQKHNDSNDLRKIQFTHIAADINDLNKSLAEGKERLRKGLCEAYLVIDPNIVDAQGGISVYTCNLKPSRIDSLGLAEKLVEQAVRDSRFEENKLDWSLYSRLGYVRTSQIDVGPSEGEERRQGDIDRFTKMMVPFFFMYLIFLGVFVNGQQMLTSVIEEKSSRIIELLISTVTPFELMAGKIIGLTCIGFVVVAIWALAAISAAEYRGLNIDISLQLIIYFIVFYVLGYLLISSIMAGIGSVCNTLRDAQNLMLPVTLLYIVPMLSWFKLVQEPNGLYSRILSFIPPITPMVMILRLSSSGDVPLFEVIISIIVLIVSVIFVIWLAAKVFRTGILMYGKKPTLGEVARWLRQR